DTGADARALALYGDAIRLAPTDPRPAMEAAGFLAARGRDAEALERLGTALAIEPNYRRARLIQIGLLAKLGRTDAARTAAAALAESDRVLASYTPDSGYAAEIA